LLFVESRNGLDRGVNALMIVVVDLEVDHFYELADRFKPLRLTEIFLELAVERFLIPVLPGRSFRAESLVAS